MITTPVDVPVSPPYRDMHWHVRCDPADPYLHDHRPGGQPLLGTVANLDRIAAGLAERVPSGRIVAIEDVRIGRPLIFTSPSPVALDIDATTIGQGSIRAQSSTGGDLANPHVAASFHLAGRFRSAPPFGGQGLTGNAVTASDVYACLFHGPSFRVVGTAALQGEQLVARSANRLPPLRRHSPASAMAPRTIEFGLQCAGLLQLALDGSMAIPLAIARIERFDEFDVGSGEPLHAVASRTADGKFDIAVGHPGGLLVARIIGYATTPLPFAHDNDAARTLASQLRGTVS